MNRYEIEYFSDLGNITRSKSVEERNTKGSEQINQYSALNLNQSSSINPRNQSSHRRLPVRYKCVFV